jgi:hypothetical protein
MVHSVSRNGAVHHITIQKDLYDQAGTKIGTVVAFLQCFPQNFLVCELKWALVPRDLMCSSLQFRLVDVRHKLIRNCRTIHFWSNGKIENTGVTGPGQVRFPLEFFNIEQAAGIDVSASVLRS